VCAVYVPWFSERLEAELNVEEWQDLIKSMYKYPHKDFGICCGYYFGSDRVDEVAWHEGNCGGKHMRFARKLGMNLAYAIEILYIYSIPSGCKVQALRFLGQF